MNHIMSKMVKIPEFHIVSAPTFKISELKRRRFNIIDRYNGTKVGPWVMIYGDIMKRGYEVEVLSVDEDGTYHIDIAGVRYALTPGKEPVEE
jgi:hypothetical protein